MKMQYLALTILFIPTLAIAAPSDVPENSWFSSTVESFVEAGYFESNQMFRPSHNATRGEFIKLVVEFLGGVTHGPFSSASFDDVNTDSSLFPYFEEAGLMGLVKGQGDCYNSHPCKANPNNPINRAEAAALMIRAFSLQDGGTSPTFKDNKVGQWFTDHIKTAASLCILKGDEYSGNVRPSDLMNRAEMLVMLERIQQKLKYPNCSFTGKASIPPSSTYKTPSKSSSNSSSTSSAIINPGTQCTEDAWVCEDWSDCSSGLQTRSCTLRTAATCINPANAKPITEKTCLVSNSSRMKDNLNKWSKLHDDLLGKAKQLSSQGSAAKDGIHRLDQIESDLISRYNEYVKMYNDVIGTPDIYLNYAVPIKQIEAAMEKIELDFKTVPSIYY